MTSLGGPDAQDSRQPSGVKAEVVPPLSQRDRGEIHEDGRFLIGTFHLPEFRPSDLKYHVGKRTITLWSRKNGQEFQTIMVLPKWVRPETFIMTHKNGVYEFLLEASDFVGLPPSV